MPQIAVALVPATTATANGAATGIGTWTGIATGTWTGIATGTGTDVWVARAVVGSG